MTNDNKTFVRITNIDIYNKIEEYLKCNTEEHNKIITRLDHTNGKVKLNKWIATTALSLTLIAIGYILSGI